MVIVCLANLPNMTGEDLRNRSLIDFTGRAPATPPKRVSLPNTAIGPGLTEKLPQIRCGELRAPSCHRRTPGPLATL